MNRQAPVRHVRSRTSTIAAIVLGLVGTLGVPGCSNGLARVSGTVTLDGDPVRGTDGVRATVYFNPTEGGVAAFGLVDDDGEYRMFTGREEGVVPGQYAVTFTATQLVPPEEPGGTPSGRRISPTRYASPSTSGLSYTIDPQGATIDLSLTSDGA